MLRLFVLNSLLWGGHGGICTFIIIIFFKKNHGAQALQSDNAFSLLRYVIAFACRRVTRGVFIIKILTYG